MEKKLSHFVANPKPKIKANFKLITLQSKVKKVEINSKPFAENQIRKNGKKTLKYVTQDVT